MANKLVFVIYDSILNSVFDGQVLIPLTKMLKNQKYAHIYVVSFETHTLDKKYLQHLNLLYPNLSVIIIKRWKFITPLFLHNQIRKLRNFLKSLSDYEIIARGPLAGFLVNKSLDRPTTTPITIQARGLLEQEYHYTHRTSSFFLSLFHAWRARQYKKIEQFVYKNTEHKYYTIEVVSIALQNYLIKTFGTSKTHIVQAQHDIPAPIPKEKIIYWRTKVRNDLNINEHARVYCFSGAAKSWQKPGLIIDYFVEHQKQNINSFLLVLTPDKKLFEKLLQKRVTPNAYRVLNIPHQRMYEHLAAADTGLVFRESGIASWVARPVKAMEYEAVGLQIVHNNTVDWLVQRYGINRDLMRAPLV